MHVTRRFTLTCTAIVLAGTALSVTRGLAHHGWDWAEGENFELTGVITRRLREEIRRHAK